MISLQSPYTESFRREIILPGSKEPTKISKIGIRAEPTQSQEDEVMARGSIGDGAAGNIEDLRGLPDE
jgi:hypothetical protein